MTRLTRFLLLLAVLASATAGLEAQQRAIAARTVQTTDTTANSVLIGCPVGSLLCTGGLKAGTVVLSGTGGVTVATGVNGAVQSILQNTMAGTAAQTVFYIGNNQNAGRLALTTTSSTWTPAGGYLADGSAVDNSGVGGLSLLASNAAGAIRFYTGAVGTPRWGINAAGDLTVGPSSRIADSPGTPSIISGFGTGAAIFGSDYAFYVSMGSTANTGGSVLFGHPLTGQLPVCVASSGSGVAFAVGTNASSTSVTLTYGSTSGANIYVLCRGY